MIGQNNLLYHKYIRTEVDDEDLYNVLIELVDDIILESLTYFYKCTSIRFLEFSIYPIESIFGKLELKYWDIRHKGIEHLNPIEWNKRNLFGDSWYEKLKEVLDTNHMKQLGSYLTIQRRSKRIYPNSQDVFRAFKLCTFEHTKVIIVSKNPYYTGTKDYCTADGLAFSYKNGQDQPNRKALDVILDEIERDCYNGFEVNKHKDLSYLAKQGVLLLNSCLTVEHGNAESHLNIGWQRFTKYVLRLLFLDKVPKVFLLWGNDAQTLYKEAITGTNVSGNIVKYDSNIHVAIPHLTLVAKHPAYDIRLENNGELRKVDYPNTFSGCEHFSTVNSFLKVNNRKEIEWLDI